MLALAGALAAGCTPGPLPAARQPLSLDHVPIVYDNNVQDSFTINDAQWSEISGLFETACDAPSERQAIAQAVARLEQIAGEQTPIGNDERKDFGHGPGLVDCLDDSANTTVFLRLMDERGLLKHHRPMNRAFRSFWCFDISHYTATIQELENERCWAVDSWFNANGIPPVIQPLGDWLRKKVVPGYYANDATGPF